jgi:hypothetical protein
VRVPRSFGAVIRRPLRSPPMSIHWSDGTNAIAAVFSAITAGIALFAADKANKTANTVARIERERWHAELTPKFRTVLREECEGHARLHVYLRGPAQLRTLDQVIIKVDDDDNKHIVSQTYLGGPTQEDYDAHIWGPWRFVPGSDHSGQDGRAVFSDPMDVGRGQPFSMERTRRGSWMNGMTDDNWQRQYAGQPIRLVFTCRRGDEKWVVTEEVDNPPLQ